MKTTGDRGQGVGGRDGICCSALLASRSSLLPRRRAAGFSIIELMIAGVIALVIFGIGLMMITGASQAHSEAKTRIRTNDKARIFFEQFEKDLSGAYIHPSGEYARDALLQTPPGIEGTCITMATTIEDPTPDLSCEFTSVRYYVVKSDNSREQPRLCREVVANESVPPIAGVLASPDAWEKNMLCSDVSGLNAVFAKWTGTEFLPKDTSDTSVLVAEATHLLVKLTLLDPHEDLPQGQRHRVYQLYIPLPDALDR
jgi:hypothetical protein